MRLGLGSYACAWAIGVPGYSTTERLDAPRLIRRAARYGLGLVQIADNIPLEKCSRAELEEIRECARIHSVALELGTRGIAPVHLRRFFDLCGFFESRVLRVVVDTGEHQPSVEEVVATLQGLLAEQKSAGVTLAIENHDRLSAAQFARIVEQIGDPAVGICLDTVNSFGSLEGPAVVVQTLAPFVVNLHLKDFTVRRMPHMMGFEIAGAPAGQGRLNVPWLLAELRLANADPNVILELWPPPQPDMAGTVALEEDWCASSLAYLRKLIAV